MSAGIEISLRLGQHVRHRDHLGQRVTGVVRGLSIDSDRVLQADIVLDNAIVIPALNADDREISIWHQHVPAHELTPFDDSDELVAELLAALRIAEAALADIGDADREPGDDVAWCEARAAEALPAVRAAISQATGAHS